LDSALPPPFVKIQHLDNGHNGSNAVLASTGYGEISGLELRDKLTSSLQTGGLSAFPSGSAADGVMSIRVLVTEFNYVHTAARVWAGMWGGKAVLNLTMTLTDPRDGSRIGEVTSASSSSRLADSEKLLSQTVEQLTARINAKRAR
jgi:hypothetical protein